VRNVIPEKKHPTPVSEFPFILKIKARNMKTIPTTNHLGNWKKDSSFNDLFSMCGVIGFGF
jgi:hypothetical protein